MKVGIVSYWFNRGQATLGRHIYDSLIASGHEVSVLARPTTKTFYLPEHVDGDGDWAVSDLTLASSFSIPPREYFDWSTQRNLDAIFFYQNYDFDSISSLRSQGVITIGGFVWEDFSAHHVERAREAFDTIYSITPSEQSRYLDFGIDSPLLHYPAVPFPNYKSQVQHPDEGILLFNGGYLSRRKPLGSTLRAYEKSGVPSELLIKSQRPILKANLSRPIHLRQLEVNFWATKNQEIGDDEIKKFGNVRTLSADLGAPSMGELYSRTSVLVTPSRWEGFGTHVFESIAHNIPILSNNFAPISDFLRNGISAVLTKSRAIGKTKSGILAVEPSVSDLAKGFRNILVSSLWQDLKGGLEELRKAHSPLTFSHEVNQLLAK